MVLRFGLLLLTLVLMVTQVSAEDELEISCEGSPDSAVTSLPKPLSAWGQVVCTKYGHVIVPRKGWIWTQPGAFAPVVIPAQMVKVNPKDVGNSVYFSKIEMGPVSAAEARVPLGFMKGFDQSSSPASQTIYRLAVTNSDGQSQTIYFVDQSGDPHKWAIWCKRQCKEASLFLLLNMSVRSKEARDRDSAKAPERIVNDPGSVVRRIAERNGCSTRGSVTVVTTKTGTQRFEVPCAGHVERYECRFTKDTRLDSTGVPVNPGGGVGYVNVACWRL